MTFVDEIEQRDAGAIHVIRMLHVLTSVMDLTGVALVHLATLAMVDHAGDGQLVLINLAFKDLCVLMTPIRATAVVHVQLATQGMVLPVALQ